MSKLRRPRGYRICQALMQARLEYALIYDARAGIWSGPMSDLDAELATFLKRRPIMEFMLILVEDPPGVARTIEQLDRGDFDGTTVVVASLTETDRDDMEAALQERATARRAQ